MSHGDIKRWQELGTFEQPNLIAMMFAKGKISLKSKNPKLKKIKKGTGKTEKEVLNNGCSSRHRYVKNFARNTSTNLDKYLLPMDIPDKKLEQYIFTVRNMRKKLNF